MKKILYFTFIAIVGISMVSCDPNPIEKNEPVNPTDSIEIPTKEETLQKIFKPYVENTVIATYSAMASEGLVLYEKVKAIEEAVATGQDYTTLMQEAGESWRRMRHYWEQSEAFLYGPVDKHYIDPHIDSWPLDYNAMNDLLANESMMKRIEEEGGAYVGATLGYALLGFHAAEYFLFKEGQYHETNLTHAQAVYLVGIVEDLTQQAIILEDCWAGSVSAEKEAFITDEEGESMSWGENYAEYMQELTYPSWKTYQEVAEQIVAGCYDIAGEVADLKLGKPYRSSNKDDQEYIESPYSYTSTIDFADNIISIRNAYCGAQAGDASVSDYIESKDEELNQEVINAINESIELIGKIQNFETTAKDNPAVKAAIDKVSELAELLEKEVMPLLSK